MANELARPLATGGLPLVGGVLQAVTCRISMGGGPVILS
jgi:hypothetical protein